jgi:hypothetical protein
MLPFHIVEMSFTKKDFLSYFNRLDSVKGCPELDLPFSEPHNRPVGTRITEDHTRGLKFPGL